jgi:hypothetical protein
MAGKKGKRDNNDYRPRKKDANLSEEEDDDFVDGEDLGSASNVSDPPVYQSQSKPGSPSL